MFLLFNFHKVHSRTSSTNKKKKVFCKKIKLSSKNVFEYSGLWGNL